MVYLISASILGLLMMLSAVIVDSQPTQCWQFLNLEWKCNGHMIGWVFWFGVVIFIFGGSSTTHEVIVKHRYEDDKYRRYRI